MRSLFSVDGVLYYMKNLIPGALDFISFLKSSNKEFLFLTNSSERSPRELQEKLSRMGIDVGAEHFYTSALATAAFLAKQRPNGSAYVIGEPGLITALYDAGFSMNDTNPDYVVVGETKNYNYGMLETAVALVRKGARLIGTNCDIADRSADSFVPACGSLMKPIELAAGLEQPQRTWVQGQIAVKSGMNSRGMSGIGGVGLVAKLMDNTWDCIR